MKLLPQLLRVPAILAGFLLFASLQVTAAAPGGRTCSLPQDLQRQLATKYPGARPVTLPDLDEDDRVLFVKEHGQTCPGLTKVDFYGDGKSTFALILLVGRGPNEKAELVIAHQSAENWRSSLLDTADLSVVPVLWSQAPGEYRDIYGTRSIRAKNPVIVFCQYSSWAIVYAWTGKEVSKVWIAD